MGICFAHLGIYPCDRLARLTLRFSFNLVFQALVNMWRVETHLRPLFIVARKFHSYIIKQSTLYHSPVDKIVKHSAMLNVEQIMNCKSERVLNIRQRW